MNSSIAVNSKCSFTDRIQSLKFLQNVQLICIASNEHAAVGGE